MTKELIKTNKIETLQALIRNTAPPIKYPNTLKYPPQPYTKEPNDMAFLGHIRDLKGKFHPLWGNPLTFNT
jgi:hypothetical protein